MEKQAVFLPPSQKLTSIHSDERLNPAHGEIRLLRMQNGHRGSDLCCKFDRVSLADAPDYVALSYC